MISSGNELREVGQAGTEPEGQRQARIAVREHERRARRRADDRSFLLSPGGRALIAAVGLMALLTVIGLIALWPGGAVRSGRSSPFGHTRTAAVTRVTVASCAGAGGGVQCRYARITVDGGTAAVDLGPVTTAPSFGAGTTISVSRVGSPAAGSADASAVAWEFVDIDRHGSLLWITVALLLLVLVVIRLRGLLAAVGVGVSLLLITTFLIPAILDGRPAVPVALVTALAVMFVTLGLTSGVGVQSLAAALGIGSTLIVTAGLAALAVHAAHIDGRTDEISAYLGTVNPGISLQGIVIAGMVIGALGVLTDTAVTQASAVMALRRADASSTPRRLYREAFLIGRDHLSATIHTLVLAYVGASLPLLLITHATGVGFGDALNTQDIAEPVLATLVGCIGLVCAVPLTTGLAAVLVARVPSRALKSAHAHHH